MKRNQYTAPAIEELTLTGNMPLMISGDVTEDEQEEMDVVGYLISKDEEAGAKERKMDLWDDNW